MRSIGLGLQLVVAVYSTCIPEPTLNSPALGVSRQDVDETCRVNGFHKVQVKSFPLRAAGSLRITGDRDNQRAVWERKTEFLGQSEPVNFWQSYVE
jgi:hypothetical protein